MKRYLVLLSVVVAFIGPTVVPSGANAAVTDGGFGAGTAKFTVTRGPVTVSPNGGSSRTISFGTVKLNGIISIGTDTFRGPMQLAPAPHGTELCPATCGNLQSNVIWFDGTTQLSGTDAQQNTISGACSALVGHDAGSLGASVDDVLCRTAINGAPDEFMSMTVSGVPNGATSTGFFCVGGIEFTDIVTSAVCPATALVGVPQIRPPLTINPALQGIGLGTIGATHTTDNADGTQSIAISGISFDGLLRGGGTQFLGPFHLGALHGVGQPCSTPTSCADAVGIDYQLDSVAAALSGHDSRGNHIGGYCAGGDYAIGGVVGSILSTRCHATVNGARVVFDLAVSDGLYCAPPPVTSYLDLVIPAVFVSCVAEVDAFNPLPVE